MATLADLHVDSQVHYQSGHFILRCSCGEEFRSVLDEDSVTFEWMEHATSELDEDDVAILEARRIAQHLMKWGAFDDPKDIPEEAIQNTILGAQVLLTLYNRD